MFQYASVLYHSLLGPGLVARLQQICRYYQAEKIQRMRMRMVENLEHLILKKSMKLLFNLEIKNWHEI